MSASLQSVTRIRYVHRHALILRIAHWIMALSILILIGRKKKALIGYGRD